ncbi:hypothetical protein EV356DRAFT_90085 [Viridothelium virens]|uniref:Uncharacterized protein n=1 Tax=Viridothelium virens TaxID=1048519 RepID=A0A6A6HDM7_VIRVR|nr:hypothetical protein EV356DRAFT_90085 [Viridothelium virens]
MYRLETSDGKPLDSGVWYPEDCWKQSGSLAGKDNRDYQLSDKELTILTKPSRLFLSLDKEQPLVSAFIGDLCQDLGLLADHIGMYSRISASLPSLLKIFTLRLEKTTESKAQRDIKEFIHQQRDRIVKKFLENQKPQQNSVGEAVSTVSDDAPPSTDMGMSPAEKMALWKNVEHSESMAETMSIEAKADNVRRPLRYQDVRSFLRDGPAYQWLLDNIRSSKLLTERKATIFDTITIEITKAFSSVSAPELRTTQDFQVIYSMDWDLEGFLRVQEYDTTLEIAVERAITITGSFSNAQALTCVDYMCQTWPSSGRQMVRALQVAVSSPDLSSSTRFVDGTIFHVDLRRPSASFEALGGQAALIEVCEQLAWLGAALRLSPTLSGICLVTPSIKTHRVPQLLGSVPIVSVRITFDMTSSPEKGVSTNLNSTCWHAMFRNPVVVSGYPILARQDDEEGLELSLKMMTDLAEVNFVTHYDMVLILKGFCTMLVPTRHVAHSITWHFLFNQDGKRIPYHSFRDRCPDWIDTDKVTIDLLESGKVRNFVGWASSITRHLGTDDMAYSEINWAGAKKCSAGLAIEQRVNISLSKIGGLSGSFVRGNRDKPNFFTQSAYLLQVKAARDMYVVLYDTEAWRGWLVDGASALLHLVRTQVVRDPYKDASLFNQDEENPIKFQHPQLSDGPDAAMDTLNNECNMRHTILRYFDSYTDEKMDIRQPEPTFSDGDPSNRTNTSSEVAKQNPSERRKAIYRTECFRELISNAWSALEKLYDSQKDRDTTHVSKQIRNPYKATLEGYEFMAIVSCEHVVTRRSVKLPPNGKAWLNLIRSMSAMTLFGQQFGEIYQPTHSVKDVICEHWKTVPRGQGYLAAPVSLLKEIKERSWREDEVEMDSAEIAKGILWVQPTDSFDICGKSCKHSFKRVQQCRASRYTLGGKSPQTATTLSEIRGAILFGKSSALNTKMLKPATSPAGSAENDIHNSGLGSSLLTSSTTNSAIESASAEASGVSSQEAGHDATSNTYSLAQ